MEYLMIVGFSLMVLTPYLLYLYSSFREYSERASTLAAFSSLQKLGEAVDWVYTRGPPSKLTLNLYIPRNVRNVTFVDKLIIWKIETSAGVSDIYYPCLGNVSGYLPAKEGNYYVEVEALGGGVNVSVSSS